MTGLESSLRLQFMPLSPGEINKDKGSPLAHACESLASASIMNSDIAA
jgi:hypothetical protein